MPTDIVLTKKQINKVKRALKALEEVRHEVESEIESPEFNRVNWYLEDSCNLCLMDGESHTDERNGNARQDFAIHRFDFTNASGGGW